MYNCAYDLNEAPDLENVGQIIYYYNGFYYNIMGPIQEPPFNKLIPLYIEICKQNQLEIDIYNSDIEICRLHMNKPEYIDSEYDVNKFRLNKEEIDQLMIQLNKEYYCNTLNNRQFDRFWDYLLYQYNKIYEKDINDYINIPNYYELYKEDIK